MVRTSDEDIGEQEMEWRDRVTSNLDILGGRPLIKGTRISVELILRWLAAGWTFEQLLEEYPHIAREDILAALAFAAERLREDGRIPFPNTPA